MKFELGKVYVNKKGVKCLIVDVKGFLVWMVDLDGGLYSIFQKSSDTDDQWSVTEIDEVEFILKCKNWPVY